MPNEQWSGSEFCKLSCWILLVKPSGSNILHDNFTLIILSGHFSGFDNLQQQWLERYENEDFPAVIKKVWTEELELAGGQKISLEKFYKQLHAYVRRKLRDFYKDQVALRTIVSCSYGCGK